MGALMDSRSDACTHTPPSLHRWEYLGSRVVSTLKVRLEQYEKIISSERPETRCVGVRAGESVSKGGSVLAPTQRFGCAWSRVDSVPCAPHQPAGPLCRSSWTLQSHSASCSTWRARSSLWYVRTCTRLWTACTHTSLLHACTHAFIHAHTHVCSAYTHSTVCGRTQARAHTHASICKHLNEHTSTPV